MDNDVGLLHEKIDQLTVLVEAQQERLDLLQNNGTTQLAEKLDILVKQSEAQLRQRDEMEELKRDVVPIINHMIKLSIDELAEIGTDFQSEDLLFLLKRLLRDTHLLVDMLDRVEQMVDLFDETSQIGQQVFNQAVVKLDQMERDGYFVFAQGSWRIVERIVTEFSEEDIEALGDNVVNILNTVKNLTQPEIMTMTNNALQAVQDQPVSAEDISIWGLVRSIADPKVREGMARLFNMVRVLSDQQDQEKI